ncbi:MAG: adenosylcobalamin-dependent ribonucleoside-diphosphate reductase [Deltaproteobacteria bacterium]|nr:adenosylcobalamin-dependent ribonucleoside-diphosphate reductase [Deltaproteobacteria bacterium]
MARLSATAQKIIENGYLLKDSFGRTIETSDDMFRRIAHTIARVEGQWGTLDEIEYYESEFLEMMRRLEFLPSPPTLMNAGLPKGQLLSSFVLAVPDSVEGITQAVQQMSILQKTGAGTGFSFSKIRPSRDVVETAGGQASGPVNFMRLFDTATDVLKQGSRVPGMNMGVLSISHPDIFEFIRCKENEGFKNFRIAVAITSHFMRCLKKDTTYPLVNPRTGQIVNFVRAADIFEAICKAAGKTGSPSLLFIDEINRHNPTPQLGEIEATSPYGEMPLLPNEGVIYGSINMANLVDDKGFNEERFEILIDLAVRFLDDAIEASYYPLPQCEKIVVANRKIGLGVMGFADLLMRLKIPYDSPKAKSFATTTMKFMLKRARQASIALAKQRGPFANFKGSLLEKQKLKPIRNATITALGPTDLLATIADISNGIAPVPTLTYFNGQPDEAHIKPAFEEFLRENEFYDEAIVQKIIKTGNLKIIPKLTKKERDIFKIASEIDPEIQLKMQAVFQKYTDNGIARVIELPKGTTEKDVYKIYMTAYQSKCKNINIAIRN